MTKYSRVFLRDALTRESPGVLFVRVLAFLFYEMPGNPAETEKRNQKSITE
jgi:hypothetical protein